MEGGPSVVSTAKEKTQIQTTAVSNTLALREKKQHYVDKIDTSLHSCRFITFLVRSDAQNSSQETAKRLTGAESTEGDPDPLQLMAEGELPDSPRSRASAPFVESSHGTNITEKTPFSLLDGCITHTVSSERNS